MRTARVMLLLLPAALLAGCLPMSIHSLVDREQDSIREDRILGEWVMDESYWTVRRGPHGYQAIKEDGELRTAYALVLTRLDRQLFMDLSPVSSPDIEAKYGYYFVPGHSISRVEFDGDTLELFMLEHLVPDAASRAAGDTLEYLSYLHSDGWRPLIVAGTGRLREFLTKHGREPVWFERYDLVRLR